jgi:hypothetical protein
MALPYGIYILVGLIFDTGLLPSVKETLLKLLTLAHAGPSHDLPPLTFAQLCRLTGRSDSTLREHLAYLSAYQAVRLQRVGQISYVVSLAGWLFPDPSTDFPGTPPINIINEEDINQLINNAYLININTPDCSGSPVLRYPEWEGGKAPAAGTNPAAEVHCPPTLSPDLTRSLQDAGVFSSLFPEIARAGLPEDDLRALLAWCLDANPRKPGGLFMHHLRAHSAIPSRYYATACPACGLTGSHAPDCRQRYIRGAYADAVEH